MAWRVVYVESPCKIFTRHNQLVVSGDISGQIPIEDIDGLVVESNRSSITTDALAKLAEANVAVYFCDNKHIPSVIALPFAKHSRLAYIYNSQADIGLVLRKQLWKSIVQIKIANQARTLNLNGHSNVAEGLHQMAESVLSGDANNREGAAAARYFIALFDDGFRRDDDNDARNFGLNYGYAVLRGMVARSIAAHGLTPYVGVFHRSDSWNLADDLMEPFRPIVDDIVAKQISSNSPITRDIKLSLANLSNYEVQIGENVFGISHGVDVFVESYVSSIENKENQLLYPEVIPLEQHRK